VLITTSDPTLGKAVRCNRSDRLSRVTAPDQHGVVSPALELVVDVFDRKTRLPTAQLVSMVTSAYRA
jgi:hypothetical protein